MSASVVRRAVLAALILGSVLTLANQGDALLAAGDVELLPFVLVYLTPFAVVSLSQVLGARRATHDYHRGRARDPGAESFISTAFSHGIAARAALLGLLAGGINTLIVIAAMVLEHGHLGGLPLGVLAQAYSLPMAFGILSQTLSYRRAAGQLRAAVQN